jgi:hypothetical protein
VLLPPGFEPLVLHVAPGEKLVLCECEGPGNPKYLLNPRLVPTKHGQYYWEAFAFGPVADQGVCLTADSVEMVDLPELRPARVFTKPRGLVSAGARVTPLPDGEGWVLSSPQRAPANLWVLSRSPVRILREGRSSLPGPIRGAAFDDRSGLLVLTDETNHLEVFDIRSMTSEGVVTLPCREVSRSVVAKDGWAWVGTREGTVIPVGLVDGSTRPAIRLGGIGDVELALSDSSGILAAMVQDREALVQPYPTHLRVYIVGEGRLVDIAAAYFETRGLLKDVAVLETTQVVAFACGSGLFTWEYRE